MKKILLFASLLLSLNQLSAANIDLATAMSTAERFVQTRGATANRLKSPTVGDLKLLHTELNSATVAQPVYYIFNTASGFVIVSGEDRAQEILAYGDAPLDMNNMPDNMKFWLGTYKKQIEFLQEHPGLRVDKPATGSKSLKAASVEPLLTAMWDQSSPYYNQCPTYNGSRCLTGCPATSLSMVFYYWKYPTDPTPAVEGYTNNSYSIEIPALPSITFDWDNMLDTYTLGNYSTEQGNAVAWLMRYVGQEEHMDYTPSASGAYGDDILRAVKFFGYDEDARLVFKSTADDYGNETVFISDADWADMLQTELAEGRPVVYCAYDYSSYYGWSGHAFNVDGFNATNNTYHVNWGWSGSGNGYYALNAFSNSGYTFNIEQQMVMGIQPPASGPTIKVNPAKLAMEAYVGKTATATFTVKGVDLDNEVTLTLNDESGAFALDATKVHPADLSEGRVVTVTYAPQSSGNHTATVTLTTPQAGDVTVTLNGEAALETYLPVMLPADSAFINLTQFRADWTDETEAKNVESYTLEVSTKPSTLLLSEVDWSGVQESYGNISSTPEKVMPDGWTFNGSGLWCEAASISIGSGSAFSTPTYNLQGYDKLTVVFTAKAYSSWASSQFTVSTGAASQDYELTNNTTFNQYVLVLDCNESDMVTFTCKSSYPQFQSVKVYAGELSEPQLRAIAEQGDATYRLVTGITDKHYTVTGLEAAGTFYYKVKATYTDGTESAWSKAQNVTLFENGHGFELGDVNHDGKIDVSDVTTLIATILGNGDEACPICSDVNGDGKIDVSDVTALIAKILGN